MILGILAVSGYITVGLITAFLTMLAFGMTAAPARAAGYLGFLYRCGNTKLGIILTLLGIVVAWPLHILLSLVA